MSYINQEGFFKMRITNARQDEQSQKIGITLTIINPNSSYFFNFLFF